MEDRLFIRLTGNGAASWLRVERSAMPHDVRHGPLHEAAAQAAGHRVIVFVSAQDVLLTHATVPAQSRKQAQQAIPYALEEQLAADVETLHFAAGNRGATGDYPTAVATRACMEAWLAQLEQAAIQPDMLVNELHALPWQPGQWTLLYAPSGALLRSDAQSGFALEAENLNNLLALALSEAGEQKPSLLRVVNYSDHALNLQGLAETWGFELTEQTRHDDPLILLAHNFDEAQAVNLLQGAYIRSWQFGTLWRPWRLSATLLGFWLLFQISSMVFDTLLLTRQNHALKAEIEQVYRGAFPETRKIVNPRQQMQSGLDELLRQGHGAAFLNLLAQTAVPLKQGSDARLRGVSYKDRVLNLDLEIKDLQALDQLKQQLTGAALEVEILSASAKENKVESRVQVRGKKT